MIINMQIEIVIIAITDINPPIILIMLLNSFKKIFFTNLISFMLNTIIIVYMTNNL